jgi:hypothetical protein
MHRLVHAGRGLWAGLAGERMTPVDKVICSLVGSFDEAQRQGAGIGALTSGPAFGGRTKVA